MKTKSFQECKGLNPLLFNVESFKKLEQAAKTHSKIVLNEQIFTNRGIKNVFIKLNAMSSET